MEQELIDLTSPPPGTVMEQCPMCHQRLPLAQLEQHVQLHLQAEDDTALGTNLQNLPTADATAACSICGDLISIAVLDEHERTHAQQQAQQDHELAQLTGADGDGDWAGGGEDEILNQDVLEQLYFEELRAKYGFTAPSRPGTCFICSKPGHWARDCPQNPDHQEAQARVVPVDSQAILDASKREPQDAANTYSGTESAHPSLPSLMQLLEGCLKDQTCPKSKQYTALLSGPVHHFASVRHDAGWGCGYRNIQMQTSHLLAARKDAHTGLFGGKKYVPDLPCLQAWLEYAWKAGFDPEGAEQLENKVQATHKWVGTTEAAVIFRYFGFDAKIVDFGVVNKSKPPQAAAAAAALTLPGLEIHIGVQCDGCGALPIRGPRYRSMTQVDHDLCESCHAGHLQMHPGQQDGFNRVPWLGPQVMPPAPSGNKIHNSKPDKGAAHAVTGLRVMEWVWKYFSQGLPQEDDSLTADGSAPVPNAAGAGTSRIPKRRKTEPAPRHRVVATSLAPLYFQHEGHSRTIVGIERRSQGDVHEYNLLLFDPGQPADPMRKALAAKLGWQKFVKRGLHTLRHSQYQVMYVTDAGMIGPGSQEYEERKMLKASERY